MSLSESGAVELKPLSDEATTTSESSSEDEKNKKKTEITVKSIQIGPLARISNRKPVLAAN